VFEKYFRDLDGFIVRNQFCKDSITDSMQRMSRRRTWRTKRDTGIR